MPGSIGTIYGYPGGGFTLRGQIVAALSGLQLDTDPDYKHFETNRTPEFKSKFPFGKAPAFTGADGFNLTESAAIGKYIASLAPNSGLLGNSPHEAALVDQWVAYADSELQSRAGVVLLMLRGDYPYVKPVDTALRETIFKSLETTNEILKSRTYLVGHRITLADIVLTCNLKLIFSMLAGPTERARFPNVVRLFETVANHSKVKPLWGEVELATAPRQYTAPAKEKKDAKGPIAAAGAAVAGAAAAVKEKVAPKKKPAAADDDDDEPLVPEEPKAKNPLDSLPKSSFNLEDWKRAYSNLDTRGAGGSLEWFDKNFDPEGFSLWKVAFKYPEELTQTFMSSNQIGGFFNRLEASRKYLFGSVGVLGSSNDSLIEGVLIARGPDIQPVVEVAPDWESYAYEKIDLKDAAQRAYFDAALAWDLEVGGKKWADGKNFK